MPLTVGQVAALPDLGLQVRTGGAGLDREVRWVAVSELADPTPWIAAGDLLLTTGMALPDDAETAGAYVARLVAADIAGLGFGVGLTHQVIPPALLEAADRSGLPLLEVPQPVPFVAVGKAVSRLLAAEEYADAAASFDCQRRLIRAALAEPDADATGQGIVQALARHVDGFALRLDAAGEVRAAHPASAAARAIELVGEIERLRPRGLLASAAIASAEEHLAILPIGMKGSGDGFLVVGSPRPLRSADQSVMNLAVSLLSWEASRPLAEDEGMDPWRRLLLAVAGDRGLSADLLSGLGLPGLDPVRAVALVWRGVNGRPVPTAVTAAVQRTGAAILASGPSGEVVGFAAVDDAGALPTAVSALAADPGVHVVGVSNVLDLTDPANVRQALDQAERAAALGSGLRVFGEEPVRGLSSLIDAATTAAWAHGYLSDLVSIAEGEDLMDTLRAWLHQHGQVDAAAQQLGIHRHTVRHRLRRAEAVLGRSLDDPAVRADLWFALAAVRAPGVGPAAVPPGRR